MKKILIRAGMSPIKDTSVEEIIHFNRIGDNVGNLVYLYSIFRALMTDEDVEIVPTNYLVSKLDVDEINENYDCFVIPLADALRNSFADEMKRMTALINKLTIPCYLIGIGVRAPYDYKSWGLAFDQDEVAYNFFKAVLNKSAMVGLRGEITADYVKKLGFVPEVDFTVIGCPSFYTYGENLNLKPLNIDKDSKIAVNNTVMTKKNVQDFLNKITAEFPNHYYYPQRVNELNTLYMGYDYHFNRKSEGYPSTIHHPLYTNDRVNIHTNIYSWMRELRTMDLSIGPRLHGNVAALLAGTPALWIVHDARMMQLSKYHSLPNVFMKDVDENYSIEQLISKVDYKAFFDNHSKNFRHYIDFLDKNEINHIFKNYESPVRTQLDIRAEKLGFADKNCKVNSILNIDKDEIICRINSFINEGKRRQEWLDEGTAQSMGNLKEKLSNTENELSEVKSELKEAQRTLWYIFRRKIRTIVDKRKKTDEETNG